MSQTSVRRASIYYTRLHASRADEASECRMIVGHLALISSSVFAGVALYVNLVEQPARLSLSDQAMLSEWKTSYRRGLVMQAPLAAVSGALGMIAWRYSGELGFLVGAILMLSNWPWTLIAMMPTNRALSAMDTASPTSDARTLIIKWGILHFARSLFGVLATIVFLVACSHLVLRN